MFPRVRVPVTMGATHLTLPYVGEHVCVGVGSCLQRHGYQGAHEPHFAGQWEAAASPLGDVGEVGGVVPVALAGCLDSVLPARGSPSTVASVRPTSGTGARGAYGSPNA